MITSQDNEKIKFLIKLKQSKYRKQEKLFIVEGPHLVEEARKLNLIVEAYSIYDKEGYIQISDNLMKKIADTDTLVSEIAICKMLDKKELTNKILILDKVQDPGNLGALMRSANAFGFKTIILNIGSVDIYNSKVIRASQGAIFKLNFRYENLVSYLDELKDYKVYGTNVVNGISLNEVKKEEKMAIILGNEGNGISNEVAEKINKNIYIPIKDTESLNVSVAGGIIMYELREK